MRYTVRVGERDYKVRSLGVSDGEVSFEVDGKPYVVSIVPEFEQLTGSDSHTTSSNFSPVAAPRVKPHTTQKGRKPGEVVAPMPGIVCGVPVKKGDTVTAGQSVCVIEAMKMENNIPASVSGVVSSIHVSQGSEVAQGAVLVTVSPKE